MILLLGTYLRKFLFTALFQGYSFCFRADLDIFVHFLSQLFGHMNVDHFTFITPSDLHPSSHKSPLSTLRSPNLPDMLHTAYSSLHSDKKTKLGDYSIVSTNPSVIPTYLPTMRVWQYNVTREEGGGWRQEIQSQGAVRNDTFGKVYWEIDDEEEDEDGETSCGLEQDPDLSPSAPSGIFLTFVTSTLSKLPSLSIPFHLPSFLQSYTPSIFLVKKSKKHHNKKKKKHPSGERKRFL